MKKQTISSALIFSIVFSTCAHGAIIPQNNFRVTDGNLQQKSELLATPSQYENIRNDTDDIISDEDEPKVVEKTGKSDYEYEIRDGKAVLTKYISDSSDTKIAVPSEIDGYSVLGLEGTFENNQRIEQAIIPNGVEFLDTNTFYECGSLKNVKLPNTLINIGNKCFANSGIIKIIVPSNVNNIGEFAFADCKNLETADLGDTKVIEINGLFERCENLKKITLPKKLEILGNNSFASCYSLETIVIPENVKEIGDLCFWFCQSLKDIKLPKKLEKIGIIAFLSCDSLEELIIPEGVNKIELSGFSLISGNSLKRIVNNSNNDYHKELYDGSKFYTWYTTETGNEIAEYLPAHSTIYRRKNDSNDKPDIPIEPDVPGISTEIKMYVRSVFKNIPSVVTMGKINTELSALNHAKSSFSVDLINEYNLDISITQFTPAISGTAKNPNGENGSYQISVWAKDEQEYFHKNIKITPIKYQKPSSSDSSSHGGGGGGRSFSSGNIQSGTEMNIGMQINKVNITSGIWEEIDGKKKLRLPDSSYATSQWAFLDEKWYLLGEDGFVITGWQLVNRKWYFMGTDGIMLSGWQIIDGKKYYLEQTGEMVTGWKEIEGKWYYMDSTGAVATNTRTPDGYTVNENGEWIK